MRVVANIAVFRHRRVFPKKRTAELGVAVVAGAVHRIASQQALGTVTVRIVATGALHLALANWMRVRLHGLRSLLLVAIEANFGLRRYSQNRVALDVSRMAIGARDGIVVM